MQSLESCHATTRCDVDDIKERLNSIEADRQETSQSIKKLQNDTNMRLRNLAIIFPFLPYASALAKAGIPTLEERRDVACAKFVSKITPGNPLHPLIHSRIIGPSSRYNLRPKAHTTMATKTDRFGGLVSVKYAPALIN